MSEYINPDDLTVTRGKEGNVLPKEEDVGSLGKAKVIPMTYGDVQKNFGDGATADVETDLLADLLREFYIEPDFDQAAQDEGFEMCNAEYVENMYPLAPRDLLMTLLESSGVDADVEMQEDNSAKVEVGN